MNPYLKEIVESKKLAATRLAKDPRIAEAKRLILAAVAEQQKTLTGIKPADPALKQSYQEVLNAFAQARGGKLWYPYLGSGIGNGALVELLDGSVKYDFITGIGVHYLGHNHPSLVEAGIDASLSNTIMQGHLQQNEDSLLFSELLLKASGLNHCFLCSSGAMANENALKIAFQKNAPAYRVLAFERCFAGRTLALTQITDKPTFREGMPGTLRVDYVPFFDAERPEESTAAAVAVLKKHITRYPKQHGAMIFELIQGEAGFYPGTTHFFTSLMEILKEHNIAIIDDEVQTFGRTSRLFAYQHFELERYVDIVTVGKLAQTCATLFRNEYQPKPGLLSQTVTSSTAVIKASIAVVTTLLHEGFYGQEGKNMQMYHFFSKKLEALSKKYPDKIRGPYGIGGMIAFTPFDGNAERANQLCHRLFEAGLICFIAGSNPTRVRFLLPVGGVTEKDIEEASKILEETLQTS